MAGLASHRAASTALVSIATADYVPFARTTLETAADHGWRGARLVVLVGSEGVDVSLPRGCEALSWSALLPGEERQRLSRRYSTGELCCALKPYALSYLLEHGFERAHYLDSDTAAFASLMPLDATLATSSVQLTPHCFADPPSDGHVPDQLTLLRSGVFNAGYVGVRACPEGKRFLRWWIDKVRRAGYVEPYLGMHGDQRWLDLVPAMFESVEIVRDKGVNVGYWNLHERSLQRHGDSWLAGGAELKLFHFSGFDPRQPDVLSRFQDRYGPGGDDPLAGLLKSYAEKVVANGYPVGGAGKPQREPRQPFARRLRDALIRRTAPSTD